MINLGSWPGYFFFSDFMFYGCLLKRLLLLKFFNTVREFCVKNIFRDLKHLHYLKDCKMPQVCVIVLTMKSPFFPSLRANPSRSQSLTLTAFAATPFHQSKRSFCLHSYEAKMMVKLLPTILLFCSILPLVKTRL